jgi:hypothetical protein
MKILILLTLCCTFSVLALRLNTAVDPTAEEDTRSALKQLTTTPGGTPQFTTCLGKLNSSALGKLYNAMSPRVQFDTVASILGSVVDKPEETSEKTCGKIFGEEIKKEVLSTRAEQIKVILAPKYTVGKTTDERNDIYISSWRDFTPPSQQQRVLETLNGSKGLISSDGTATTTTK